ncbi:MAG: CDP-diacylglycerol--glycerol-3-phosphate 3-phosphatidyltransferase [Candidatus Aureabacteria bacterium]|nr:CDP-diacylglycerol--glycerol-3-phosphate 3-phosphatidyltransferase [Candidatus Auribacterota bacterium]
MLNLPNFITIIRILFVPCFVALLLRYRETGSDFFRWGALIVFAAAASSDVLDGLIARLRAQKSILGSFLDPVADKLLLNAAVICMSLPMGHLARLPGWFPVLVISRDLIIVVGALLIHMIKGKVTPAPSVTGKVTTLFQMLTVIWVLLLWPHHLILLSLAAVFTLISGIEYIFMGLQQLQSPSP